MRIWWASTLESAFFIKCFLKVSSNHALYRRDNGTLFV